MYLGHDPAAIRLVVEDVIKGVLTKTFGNNTYGTMPDISELTKAVMLSQGITNITFERYLSANVDLKVKYRHVKSKANT